MAEKLTEQELIQKITDASQLVTVGGRYEHYKGGRYTVIDLAILTEGDEIGVIYRAEYGDKVTFVRPLSDWLEPVEREDSMVSRFSLVTS